MGLPDSVTLKFGAYTLACHHLTAHLPALSKATQNDTRRTDDVCCAVFDEELAVFLKDASSVSLPEAASQLGERLRSRANLFRRDSPAAADVFNDVIAAMVACAPTWDYTADIQEAHDLGRDLARHFYANSPYAITQEQCHRECPLEFKYGMMDEEGGWPMTSAFLFDYHAAPVGFHPQSENIVVRFSVDNDLALYLAYPFLFLHEYTAHVYATDYGGNDRFNDGWMLHAADIFLRKLWNPPTDPLVARMPRKQAHIFHEHFYGIVKGQNPMPGRGCQFARHFEPWLVACCCDPERFNAITFELAAFEPGFGRPKNWPTDFLNRLEQEFDHNRAVLCDKIKQAVNLRELYAILALA